MELAASIVTYTVDPAQADLLRDRVRDHLVPAAQALPGYKGFALFDQGENRRMAILLFESIEQVGNAQHALSPVGEEYTYALMTGPAIGSAARALVADGLFALP
jgi:hypothetical protein